MSSKCNVVKFSLAYSAELGQGSAWVKIASLGVFKMALRQAGYTAWTASSSLDDKSCHNLKGDLLFSFQFCWCFSHTDCNIPCGYTSLQTTACDSTHSTAQDSPILKLALNGFLWAFPLVLHGKYPPYNSLHLRWILESKTTEHRCRVQKIWGLPRERSYFFTHTQKSSQTI